MGLSIEKRPTDELERMLDDEDLPEETVERIMDELDKRDYYDSIQSPQDAYDDALPQPPKQREP